MIVISQGDGDTVRTGKWQYDKKAFLATSQVVFRTVPMTGRAIPEAENSETFRELTSGRLRGSRWGYRHLQQFSDLDFLDALIGCDRRAWDGHADRKDFVP